MTGDQSGTTPRLFIDPIERSFSFFKQGDVIITRRRTVEQADIVLFAGLVGNFYPLHVDVEYANATRFGSRVAHGSLIYSIAVGLVELNGYYGNSIIAMLGVTDLIAQKPVRAGDTIHVQATVTELIPSATKAGGRMVVLYSVRNQIDEEVLTFVQTMLINGESE